MPITKPFVKTAWVFTRIVVFAFLLFLYMNFTGANLSESAAFSSNINHLAETAQP
jgi:hypothetical protein